MLKKLMLSTAFCALTLTGALAQSSTPAPQNAPAATQSQDATGAKDMSKDSSMPAAQTTGQASTGRASGKADFVMSQKPDQWLASKFKGTDVLGQDNQKIGDVSDILFDKAGQIEAYIVSVGGFLGMGSKEVALAPKAFDVVPGSNGAAPKLKLSMSKDELKQAQNFTPYSPPRATTGSGGGMKPGGLGGGATPSSNRGPSGK